jgi:hypothetical protein
MTIETTAIAVSVLASAASLSAAYLGRKPRQAGPERTVTVTIEDPATGLVRTVMRSTRRLDQIRRDVERVLRDGC